MEVSTTNEPMVSAVDVRLDVQDGCYKQKGWINLRRRAKRNGYGLLKQVLVDAIKEKIKENGILHKSYDYVLALSTEICGGEVKYKTWDDIPEESVPCPCGNPKHWLIKYKDLR